ncbi:MAG: phosphodiesterase [Ignavibacteria bacterium]
MRRTLVFILLLLHVVAHASTTVRSGPMVGYGEMREALLWVQLSSAGTVQYRYWITGEKSKALVSAKTSATKESDYIATVVLTDLTPGSRYEYELLLDGKPVPLRRRLTFVTQPLWQWRTDPPAFTVAFGSCSYVNDPPSDRPGKPYGGSYSIFEAIAAKQPEVMLWLGDNWYYREDDYYAPSRMRKRPAYDRSLPALQHLLGSTHHYAVWDDHDFGSNDADRTYRFRTEALAIFKMFWPNPTFGTLETPGVFFRFMWGDVEFFLLDDRFYRSPNAMPETPHKTMFGRAQLEWLKEGLISSRATFKVIVNGNQLLAKHGFETLRNYPFEFDELMGWIKGRKIPGVLFLSGDRHFAELSVLADPAFYPLYDFTSSPLTAGYAADRRPEENPLHVAGTFVNDTRNFGLLRFDGPLDDRRVKMELCDSTGAVRWSRTVKASELKPPAGR